MVWLAPSKAPRKWTSLSTPSGARSLCNTPIGCECPFPEGMQCGPWTAEASRMNANRVAALVEGLADGDVSWVDRY